MEVPYIFVVLNAIAVLVYVYSTHVFNFADTGVQYLSNLALKDTEKINSDPTALPALKGRDLPNTQIFSGQRERILSLIVATFIINLVNYIMYPYEGLLYSWMEYILIGACIATNIDTILIAITMRKNKHIVDTVCTAYYKLTLRNDEENAKLAATVASIEEAFNDMLKDLNEHFTDLVDEDDALEDKNENDINEK